MRGLESPENASGIERIVDWLELNALFDEQLRARIDTAVNSLEIAEDYFDANISRADEYIEAVQTDVAEEVTRRTKALEGAYPFTISKNGEQLLLAYNAGDVGQTAYLACLVIDHSWASGLLITPARLNGCETIHARSAFEVFSTIAASGYARGPAFHVGGNRRGARGLLACVARVCERANEGEARLVPPADAPENANDDGVDVIALALESDGPPARCFVFGQAASGANWKTKSILVEIEKFLETWFQRRPVKCEGIMLVPTILLKHEANRESRRVGHILHRLRLPRYARAGAELLGRDHTIVDVADQIGRSEEWLVRYVERVRGEVRA